MTKGQVRKPNTIGRLIAYYRQLRGVTQKDLAELIGTTSGYISMVELERTTLSEANKAKIIDFLEIDEADVENPEIFKDINNVPVRNLRPCVVNGKNAHFHKWVDVSKIVEPSLIRGGHNGGVISNTFGLVEFANGEVSEVAAHEIKFTDRVGEE